MSETPNPIATAEGQVKTIAYLCGGVEEITIYKAADKGLIPKPAKGQAWDIGLCAHKFNADARARFKATGGESRASILTDEAKQARMKTAEMEGELGSRKNIIADLKDALTKGAMEIQRLGKTPAEKKLIAQVIKVLRVIKLPSEKGQL